MALSEPFLTNTAAVISPHRTHYDPRNTHKVLEGYFCYNFWKREFNLLPYYVGTYLGSKKVFNLGAGFMSNPNAMWSADVSGDTIRHDLRLFAFDAFLDLPLGAREDALTAYAVYYLYDFGPNNLRNIGILNSATGSTVNPVLRGNAYPVLGTGNILYLQAGYLLPRGSSELRIQPYAGLSTSRFEGLQDSSGDVKRVNVFDIGTNFHLVGHHAKITLNYRSRPDFTDVNNIVRRSELVLQTMIYL